MAALAVQILADPQVQGSIESRSSCSTRKHKVIQGVQVQMSRRGQEVSKFMVALRLFGRDDGHASPEPTENEIKAIILHFYNESCLSHNGRLQRYIEDAQDLSDSDREALKVEIKKEEATWVDFVRDACDDYRAMLWIKV